MPRREQPLDRLGVIAARIAYDVDFSTPSQRGDDRMLAEALAHAGPERIVLPVFRYLRQTTDNRIEPVDTGPLNRSMKLSCGIASGSML